MLSFRSARALVRPPSVRFPRVNASLLSSTSGPSFEHPSFKLVDDTFVDEYGIRALRYTHKQTGADVLSLLAPEDANKVFSINFRTPVSDSTGVPHIMEHSVLCGSRKYPVKEPFVDMMKGSLHTFLNAFTYPDRTCYPVASMNTKDFYNLINVYLDGVLHPRALTDPHVLQQEGWHYELDALDQPLKYKGVVYNEMKGVYSSPESLLYKKTQQALFPNNSYVHDSGGDPLNIPDLSWEQFKAFHARHYHPSNARIFFYGDDDPVKRLELIETYLREYGSSSSAAEAKGIQDSTKVQVQPKFSTPKYVTGSYPITSEAEEKHMLTVNWLLNDQVPMDRKEAFALAVLNHLLLGTSTSVLHKALIESKLGENVIGGGIGDELIQSTFSVGLKGITAGAEECKMSDGMEQCENHTPAAEAGAVESASVNDKIPACMSKNIDYKLTLVEDVIYSTLRKVAAEGFDPKAIQASININEFYMREFNTGSYPKGLAMMQSILGDWIYNEKENPMEGVRFEKVLQELKDEIASTQSKVFQDLVQKYFLDNKHRVVVHMQPDRDMEGRIEEQEVTKLHDIKSAMTPEQLQRIMDATKELKEAQLAEDSDEAKSTLPRLTLQDIEREEKKLPIRVTEVKRGVPTVLSSSENDAETGITSPMDTVLLTHELQTNGILYADIGFDYSNVDQEDMVLLPLFSRMLLECGTTTMDEEALHQWILTETGGVSTSYRNELKYAHNRIADPADTLLYFMIRGKVTADKIPKLFEIVHEVMSGAKLDNQKRFVEMLKETKASKESSVVNAGHSFAATRLASKYSFLGYLGEQTGGITYINKLNGLLEQAENDWPSVLHRLNRIREAIYVVSETPQSEVQNCAVSTGSVRRPSTVINLTGSPDLLNESTIKLVDEFVSKVPVKSSTGSNRDRKTIASWSSDLLSPPATAGAEAAKHTDEGFIIPSQVNYVVKGGYLMRPGEVVGAEDGAKDRARMGSFAVISKFLSTNYLWDHVRVLGGAYGASCSFGSGSGRFQLSSYRDPNVVDTLNVYDNCTGYLLEGLGSTGSTPAENEVGALITDEVILQNIIGSVGDLDSPQSPDQKGRESMSDYLRGEKQQHKQQYRDEVISTGVDDFRLFAERLKVFFGSSSAQNDSKEGTCAASEQGQCAVDAFNAGAYSVVLGPEKSLEAANEQLQKAGKRQMTLQYAIEAKAKGGADSHTDNEEAEAV